MNRENNRKFLQKKDSYNKNGVNKFFQTVCYLNIKKRKDRVKYRMKLTKREQK